MTLQSKFMLLCSITLAGAVAAPWKANAAPGDSVPLPNPGFETVTPFPAGQAAPAGVAAADMALCPGTPDGWTLYQWGTEGGRFFDAAQTGAGRGGGMALRAQNLNGAAQAGVKTHMKLMPGTYQLAVWARAEPGQTALAKVYLANIYSRPFKVTDRWTLVTVQTTLSDAIESAEINMQNISDQPSVVWFDDAVLRELPTPHYSTVPDNRPPAERPRTLMFSPMNVNYLRDTAPQWAARGFRGFLFDEIMTSWETDVWAADGNPATRGEDDALLHEVRECNKVCRSVGIESNFIKVALYKELPDPFDDAAWDKLANNFREGARFARMSGCAGIALDTEYDNQQYQPAWAGYQLHPHPLPELRERIRSRWQHVVAGMLQEFPNMVLLNLPEGPTAYGELAQDIFNGELQAMADDNATGGMHLLAEGTYHTTDLASLASFAESLTGAVIYEIPPSLDKYWKTHCSVALGAWPLGFYREIGKIDGKYAYSGKQATFGDKPVGSYADKSEWYSSALFARQMAGLNSFSPRYNWIYSHGDVFWQWSPEQEARYRAGVQKTIGNASLPTVPNLDEYFAAIAHPSLAVMTH